MITPRPLLAVDAVYNDAVVGKDMVRVMFHVRGAQPPAALVQFHDSRSLYRCSLVAPYTWTLLYDSQTEPGLASDFNVYVSGDHAAHGYAYILGQEYGVANQAWPLVLLDSDRDGAIDDHFVLDFDAYHFAQFDDRESWLEYKRLTD